MAEADEYMTTSLFCYHTFFTPMCAIESQSINLSTQQERGADMNLPDGYSLPQNHMFASMRRALGIQKPTDILAHIRSLPTDPPHPNTKTTASPQNHHGSAVTAIKSIEETAMTMQTPQPGLSELMTYLDRRGIRKGLCTRNFEGPVDHLRAKFLAGVEFQPVITRESVDIEPKPSPMGIWHCAAHWAGKGVENGIRDDHDDDDNVELGGEAGTTTATKIPADSENLHPLASSLIMVGDSIDDMAAGRYAGAATILLVSHETDPELFQAGDELLSSGGDGGDGSIDNGDEHENENEEESNDTHRNASRRQRRRQRQRQRQHEYVDLVVWRLDEIIDVLERGFEGVAAASS